MVNTLQSVDSVGLVRAGCQEPSPPSYILSDSVTGAIERLLIDHHWGIATVAAGAQIRLISKKEEPFDQSVQPNAESFLSDFYKFLESFGKYADDNKYGFMDLLQPAQPCVVAIAAPWKWTVYRP
jgi:hypothetical protein